MDTGLELRSRVEDPPPETPTAKVLAYTLPVKEIPAIASSQSEPCCRHAHTCAHTHTRLSQLFRFSLRFSLPQMMMNSIVPPCLAPGDLVKSVRGTGPLPME